jgi:pimeloyl-ACP methyl ester carboxylesterase
VGYGLNTLVQAGHRVITFDHRGHGQSEKLYDSALYPAAEMAEDAARLLDYLGIGQADVMGYSMGARVSAFLTLSHPERVRKAVFAGLASRMITGVGGAEAIARALEADNARDVIDPGARAFRLFADQTKSDRRALAACIRSSREKISAEDLSRISVPVLVVAGDMDDVAGDVETLVSAIPGSKGVTLSNRNHMNAVGDRGYKDAVLAFLSE